MKAEILSVGTELLLGHLTDTNAPYLARSPSELGIDVHVRITAKAATLQQAQAMVTGLEVRVREILGDHVYGVDELVSDETAGAMARAARESLGADIGLAATCGTEGSSSNSQNLGVVHCAVDCRGEVLSLTNRYSTTPGERCGVERCRTR